MQKIEHASLLKISFVLCLIGFLLYVRMLGNNFALGDDKYQIQVNALIKHVNTIPQLFLGSTVYDPSGKELNGVYYKPLMETAFALIYVVFKLNPFGYHLFDLVFHLINTILLFVFLRKLFALQKMQHEQVLSFFISLIFLIHPVNVESVAFIASTQELLYMFFLFITMLVSLRFLEKSSKKLLIIITVSTFASLLSKEAGVVALIVSPLAAYLYNRSKTIALFLANATGFLLYILLRLGIARVPFDTKIPEPIMMASLPQRLITIPYELYTYIRLIFFPKDLYIWYLWVVRSISDTRFVLLLPFDLLIIGFFVLFLFKLKSKLYIFFFTWAMVGFGIVSNIFPIDATIAERWVYGPLIGVLGMVALIAAVWIKKSHQAKVWVLLILVIFLPFFAIRSYMRIGDWKDTLTLFGHDEQYHQDSSIYYYHYGLFLKDAGKTDMAQQMLIRYIYNAHMYGPQ